MLLAQNVTESKVSRPDWNRKDAKDVVVSGIMTGSIGEDNYAHEMVSVLRLIGVKVTAGEARVLWKEIEKEERSILQLPPDGELDRPYVASAQKVAGFDVSLDYLDALQARGAVWTAPEPEEPLIEG